MALTLQITNVEVLDNAEPTRLVLDRHGANIGRSPNGDWCLPDDRNFISSQHCSVVYQDGAYLLIDRSKNGTYLNGSASRMAESHRLVDGDEITIGQYKLRASLGEGPAPPPAARPVVSEWRDEPVPGSPVDDGWGTPTSPPAPPPVSMPRDSGWSEPASAPSGQDRWGAPASPPPPASADAWDAPVGEARAPIGQGWADEVYPRNDGYRREPPPPPRDAGVAMRGEGLGAAAFAPPPLWPGEPERGPPQAGEGDVWAQFSATNEVDWARGGFGQPAETMPPAPARRRDAPPADGGAWEAMLQAAGLTPRDLRSDPRQAGAAAGALLKRLTAGLVVMLEARKRAKDQLGAQGTMFTSGHNPLKFGGRPEQALVQLLNPPDPGFMGAEAAIEDSFQDLQAHQLATLAAMQGALRQTLERFSPHAIRERAEGGGVISRLLPMAREAEFWRAYEREFDGVVRGSDEAFLDVFARAFREAYDEAAARMKARR